MDPGDRLRAVRRVGLVCLVFFLANHAVDDISGMAGPLVRAARSD